MENLLAKLSEQQVLLQKQKSALNSADFRSSYLEQDESISDSVPLTPATDSFDDTPDTENDDTEKTVRLDPIVMLRLKKELDAAKDKIARQERELSQTRSIKHTLDRPQAIPASASTAQRSGNANHSIGQMQDAFNTTNRVIGPRLETFGNHDDDRSDISDILSAGAYNRAHNVWTAGSGAGYPQPSPAYNDHQFQQPANIWGQARSWINRPTAPALAPLIMPPQQQMQHRTYSGPTSPMSADVRFGNEIGQFAGGQGLRRSHTQNGRSGSAFVQARNSDWAPFGRSSEATSMTMSPTSSCQSMGMFQAPMTYHPRPIGTPLSPTAAEFTGGNMNTNVWNSTVSTLSDRPFHIAYFSSEDTCFSRTNLCLSDGTPKLSAFTRPKCYLQLEIYC